MTPEQEEQSNIAIKWMDAMQRVRTIKGGRFCGHVAGSYVNTVMGHVGVVVIADDEHFLGTAHVYPVKQLEEC